MKECKCTLAQRMVGDGCSVCNPAKALEYADETIAELRAEIKRLHDAATDLLATVEGVADGLLDVHMLASSRTLRDAIDRYIRSIVEESER